MDKPQGAPAKDFWDKLSALSGMVAAVLVPLVIALVGNWYSAALKDREASLSEAGFKREWVQLGLSILRDANTSNNARQWAIDIINNYSDVKMPKESVADFVQRGAVLPAAAPSQVPMSPPSAAAVTDAAPVVTTTDRVSQMNSLQTRGIGALLDRDLKSAAEAYQEAYKTWPAFRNVDEIRRLLERLKAAPPSGDEAWKEVYRRIRGFDLRGVSDDVRERLKASAQ